MNRKEAYLARLEKGTQHNLTRQDQKKGFKVTATRYPDILPGIMRKWLGVKSYNGWDRWEGNKPK